MQAFLLVIHLSLNAVKTGPASLETSKMNQKDTPASLIAEKGLLHLGQPCQLQGLTCFRGIYNCSLCTVLVPYEPSIIIGQTRYPLHFQSTKCRYFLPHATRRCRSGNHWPTKPPFSRELRTPGACCACWKRHLWKKAMGRTDESIRCQWEAGGIRKKHCAH